MTRVVYGCVTNSLERVQRYVLPRVGDRSLILMWNQTSLAAGYNRIIEACGSIYDDELTDVDALVLIHDDLELVDPDAEQKFLEALAGPSVGLVGVAGAYRVNSLAWWNGVTVGHQLTNSAALVWGGEGDVECLEGSVLVLSRCVIDRVRFDEETFTGFHGYDCDFSMKVRAQGKRVVVADVDTHHHTTFGFDSAESECEWHEANREFRRKWNLGGSE